MEQPAKRPSIEAFRQLAESHGGQCLSDRYVSVDTPMRWRCAEGHVWETLARSVWNGYWRCPECESAKPELRLQELRDIAKERGGECLSTTYRDSKTKLMWQCEKGHVWRAVPGSVKNGSWCPHCRGRHRTIKEMRALAKTFGGRCLSAKYEGSFVKLRWRCERGHEFESPPTRVVRGHWCPYCQGYGQTIADMQALAQRKDGKCLSSQYVNSSTKLRWQCAEGHEFESTPAHVKQGKWCPHCRGLYKTIEDMQEMARQRGGECLSRVYVNNKTKLRWRCAKGHVWESKPITVHNGHWCWNCGQKVGTIEAMQAIAKERGGSCLSTKYINNETNLRWRCAEGHEWETRPNHITAGQWCPECARQRPRKSIADMQALAAKRGGKCLSPRYVNCKTKLRWQCAEGHVWETTPTQVVGGAWCRPCAQLNASRAAAEKLRARSR